MSLPITSSPLVRRRHYDGGAVLVVVEDRDLHARLERLLDDEALGGLDVLEVDAAEGGLEAGDGLDELLGVALVDLDVEHVDVRELLEEHRLAFHHRLAGQGPDGPQPEHRGAVGDHRHQVAAGGVVGGGEGIGGDLLTGGGHARRIGQGQIPLIGQGLGGLDGQLPGTREAMVFERAPLELFGHGGLLAIGRVWVVRVYGMGRAGGPVRIRRRQRSLPPSSSPSLSLPFSLPFSLS
jgi:hypothetical protein